MNLTRVTDHVSRLALPPRSFINAYLVGDVLVDAGLAQHAGGIIKALAGHAVVAHVITHAHGDHVGGSKRVSDALGVPAWCGAGDAAAVRAGKPVAASRLQSLFRWKPVEVARELGEGDEVGPGFTVLDVPGHSPGQIALWREHDRTLICGDVFLNRNFYTTLPGLNEPPRLFTVDPARNREAARRLAELEPELVLFGHGKPLRDPAKLAAFAKSVAVP
ncbi:MAG TPA: MBL fold metallo-hydrolase [Solirubrobacteraceae bacterium]|nr:MBL fold metallo-hydrolase [Solirubrobacteraceae bacterium]